MSPGTRHKKKHHVRSAVRTRRVDLADLPQWSPWPARLLGLQEAPSSKRTLEKIDREYDKDRYARCLEYARQAAPGKLSIEKLREFEQGADSSLICTARGNRLLAIPGRQAIRCYEKVLLNAMRAAIRDVSVVVELGCGYGYHLWNLSRHFPGKRFIGGDYSENAVRLAAFLFETNPNIKVSRLDLYSPRYDVLADLGGSGPMLIYTVHAVEQIASATPFLEALSPHRSRIRSVFNFEAVNEDYDDSLLGLMRRRYAEVNDYNRDLVSRLKERKDISIVRFQKDVFGANPLYPISVIQWKFKAP